jgi:hypothetical protein
MVVSHGWHRAEISNIRRHACFTLIFRHQLKSNHSFFGEHQLEFSMMGYREAEEKFCRTLVTCFNEINSLRISIRWQLFL